MKMIIIIVGALVVLLGGAGGGLYFTDNLGLIGLGGGEEEVVEKDVVEEKKKKDAVYIALNQLVIPVIKGQRIAYQIYLDLNLEVENQADKNDVASVMPRIQDAIMVNLMTQPLVDTEGFEKIDIHSLKRRLLKTVRKAMGDDTVQKILVTKVMRAG